MINIKRSVNDDVRYFIKLYSVWFDFIHETNDSIKYKVPDFLEALFLDVCDREN